MVFENQTASRKHPCFDGDFSHNKVFYDMLGHGMISVTA